MSTEKELAEKDYDDAAWRFKECAPAVIRLQEIAKATAEYVRFLESPAGHAAMRMLAAANKHIEFARIEAITSEGRECTYSHQLNGQGWYAEVAPDGLTRESRFRRSDVVAAWLEQRTDCQPKDFMPWFKAELKKIHDDAPNGEANTIEITGDGDGWG